MFTHQAQEETSATDPPELTATEKERQTILNEGDFMEYKVSKMCWPCNYLAFLLSLVAYIPGLFRWCTWLIYESPPSLMKDLIEIFRTGRIGFISSE